MEGSAGALARYRMFIGGEWADAAPAWMFESFNLYTARPWAEVPEGGVDHLAEIEVRDNGKLIAEMSAQDHSVVAIGGGQPRQSGRS